MTLNAEDGGQKRKLRRPGGGGTYYVDETADYCSPVRRLGSWIADLFLWPFQSPYPEEFIGDVDQGRHVCNF